jgi:UDP-GlcNAc3NAcA epimerase
MIKLLTIIGTRPQIIKAAAMSRAIRNGFSEDINDVIVHTGQHYDDNMSRVFFDELGVPLPDYSLEVGSGAHGCQTANMIRGIEEIILMESPDFVVLYGDTNSTLAGAVAASKMVPVVHIEAGLRSFNKRMPEEINRIVCDHCSTYLFTPTMTGYDNLIREGFAAGVAPYTIDNPGVFCYGDVMYDNALYFADNRSTIVEDLNLTRYALVTIHRDYNTDESLSGILDSLNEISEDIEIVFPIHPRTFKNIRNRAFIENNRIKKLRPVSFFDMMTLEKNASMIMTDSGGVQKEAYFFGKPCVILRTETEWVEMLDTGMAILAGQNITNAYRELSEIGDGEFPPIFGMGNAAERICKELINER